MEKLNVNHFWKRGLSKILTAKSIEKCLAAGQCGELISKILEVKEFIDAFFMSTTRKILHDVNSHWQIVNRTMIFLLGSRQFQKSWKYLSKTGFPTAMAQNVLAPDRCWLVKTSAIGQHYRMERNLAIIFFFSFFLLQTFQKKLPLKIELKSYYILLDFHTITCKGVPWLAILKSFGRSNRQLEKIWDTYVTKGACLNSKNELVC